MNTEEKKALKKQIREFNKAYRSGDWVEVKYEHDSEETLYDMIYISARLYETGKATVYLRAKGHVDMSQIIGKRTNYIFEYYAKGENPEFVRFHIKAANLKEACSLSENVLKNENYKVYKINGLKVMCWDELDHVPIFEADEWREDEQAYWLEKRVADID
jgi:hypothetical protein